jgi:phosphoglycolate phosphatase-like HAD superfamily hydrolase
MPEDIRTRVRTSAASTAVSLAARQPCDRHAASAKPVRITVGQLDAEPGECVFIGDTETDVLAGMLAGVPVIGYANKPGNSETLSLARAVVNDPAEITEAFR